MQLAAVTPPTATPPVVVPVQLGGVAEVKRGLFAKPVSLVFGAKASDFASFDDALAAAKQLSAGPAPAAVVFENRYTEGAGTNVPADQHFSVYSVDFQQWKGSRGGQLESSGPYHHGEFSRTKGYDLADDEYSNGFPHEAMVLVDDDQTWDNGIAPS
jgi:hypothetical protein